MATMQDVAKAANVSLSTVSYAMSGTRPVSEATRRKIAAAMEELGYEPNAAARSLATRRSNVLALVYPATQRGLGGTVTEFVDAALLTAREHGYQLVLWPFRTDEADQIVALARQGQADGVLVMEVGLDDARIEALQAAGVPYTMIGRTRDHADRPWVDVDFDSTIREAIDLLTGLGHQHIGFINHSQESAADGYAPTFRAEEAFEAVMAERGLRPLHLRCDETPPAGRAAIAELYRREPRLTAVIAMNELAGFGVMAELQARGLSVPRDVSLLSIVSSPNVGQMTNPPLSTLHAPGAALGRAGVLKLLSLVGAPVPDVTESLIGCSLAEGGSVAPVAG